MDETELLLIGGVLLLAGIQWLAKGRARGVRLGPFPVTLLLRWAYGALLLGLVYLAFRS